MLRQNQLIKYVKVPSNLLSKEWADIWFKNCPKQKNTLRNARFHWFSFNCHPWGDWIKQWPTVFHGILPKNMIPKILAQGFKVPDAQHTSHKHVFEMLVTQLQIQICKKICTLYNNYSKYQWMLSNCVRM